MNGRSAAKSRERQPQIMSGVTVAVALAFLHHDLHLKEFIWFIGKTPTTRPPGIGFGPALTLAIL
jgi:hypothetical protein